MKKILALVFTFLAVVTAQPVFSQEPASPSAEIPLVTEDREFRAEIIEIERTDVEEFYGTEQISQTMKVRVLSGIEAGKDITFTHISSNATGNRQYNQGDKVVISEITQPDGSFTYFVLDYVRTDSLLILAGLFVFVVIGVAGKRGFAALLGMVYSFVIIFMFVLPQISSGKNPILIALLSGLLVVPVTFYLSHGLNKKTHAAILGTMVTLLITGILAFYAVDFSHLTGFSSEDASFLQIVLDGSVNIKGLLLAGIIVGLFGILDDITISQAAIVYKLKETSPHLSNQEIYDKSMDVGKDHIGSLINTLILVYTGAALPFLLLITAAHEPLSVTLNYEIIAEEIVRTLTASIGLVLAVPITTFIATRLK